MVNGVVLEDVDLYLYYYHVFWAHTTCTLHRRHYSHPWGRNTVTHWISSYTWHPKWSFKL